jgi:hypothetical protein
MSTSYRMGPARHSAEVVYEGRRDLMLECGIVDGHGGGSSNNRSVSMRYLAIAIAVTTAATNLAGQPRSNSELTAASRGDAVNVSFDLHAENGDDLELRLSRQSVTTVSWVIDLHRLNRYWLERLWASATIRVVARPLDNDTVSISRKVNGRIVESGILVDRRGAIRSLTSFSDVPLFEHFQLARDTDHVLTIRATVEGGGENTIVTSTLASARLCRSARSSTPSRPPLGKVNPNGHVKAREKTPSPDEGPSPDEEEHQHLRL